MFPHLSKKLPAEKHTHCAHLPPVHTHPTSVPLRLINKSKILPALLSQTTICSLWDMDSFLCSSVVLPGVSLPSKDALLHHRMLKLTKTVPWWNTSFTPSLFSVRLLAPLSHLSFFFCSKWSSRKYRQWISGTVLNNLLNKRKKIQEGMVLADCNFFHCCSVSTRNRWLRSPVKYQIISTIFC